MTRIIKYNSTTIKCSFLRYQLLFFHCIFNGLYPLNKGRFMKSHIFYRLTLLLLAVTTGLMIMTSCAKKENKAFRLLTPDSLSTEETDYIKSREPFNENEVHDHLEKTARAAQPLTEKADAATQKPQWPVKLNLVPVKAPFFENANLLLTADCAPIVLENFHSLMNGKRVIIGCPKFEDARAYAQKLTEIFKQNNIQSVTVIHMEVPCCTGLKWAANKAIELSSKQIPVREYEVKIGGEIVELKQTL